MTQPTVVEVVDRNGWRRQVPLTKAIVYIGSAPGNDVVLENAHGGGISPRHLQLIPGPGGGFRLVNLGGGPVTLGEKTVAPHAVADVLNGDQIRLGEFTLTLRGSALPLTADQPAATVSAAPAPAGVQAAPSQSIQLRLNLTDTLLLPARPVAGSVTVRNTGGQPSVQFRFDIDGLPPDCFEIDPGPILFPNAEKEVAFHLHHPRSPRYPVGDHRVGIRATAPAGYPGEQAVVSFSVQIAPYYNHVLRLIVPGSEGRGAARGRGQP
jgi:hypothetical protein